MKKTKKKKKNTNNNKKTKKKVSFVDNKKNENEDNNNNNDYEEAIDKKMNINSKMDEDIDSMDEERPSFANLNNFGFNNLNSPNKEDEKENQKKNLTNKVAKSYESKLPTSFGASSTKKNDKKKQNQPQETTKNSNEIGSFEKYTKGIGSKLLMKMGWKPGEGVGKDGSGISKPVEAIILDKGKGLGYGKTSKDYEEVEKIEEEKEAELNEKEIIKEAKEGWKKEKKRKKKYELPKTEITPQQNATGLIIHDLTGA